MRELKTGFGKPGKQHKRRFRQCLTKVKCLRCSESGSSICWIKKSIRAISWFITVLQLMKLLAILVGPLVFNHSNHRRIAIPMQACFLWTGIGRTQISSTSKFVHFLFGLVKVSLHLEKFTWFWLTLSEGLPNGWIMESDNAGLIFGYLQQVWI